MKVGIVEVSNFDLTFEKWLNHNKAQSLDNLTSDLDSAITYVDGKKPQR